MSGTVGHHTPESLRRIASNAPKSTQASSKRRFDVDAPIEAQPRVFSQTFVLVNGAGAATEGGVPFIWTHGKSKKDASDSTVAHYFIQADSLRFVG